MPQLSRNPLFIGYLFIYLLTILRFSYFRNSLSLDFDLKYIFVNHQLAILGTLLCLVSKVTVYAGIESESTIYWRYIGLQTLLHWAFGARDSASSRNVFTLLLQPINRPSIYRQCSARSSRVAVYSPPAATNETNWRHYSPWHHLAYSADNCSRPTVRPTDRPSSILIVTAPPVLGRRNCRVFQSKQD